MGVRILPLGRRRTAPFLWVAIGILWQIALLSASKRLQGIRHTEAVQPCAQKVSLSR